MDRVILAYSGGLDTSFCVKYLSEEKELDVYTILINTGGFSKEEINAVTQRAEWLGSKKHLTLDKTNELYKKCIKYLIAGNVLKNSTYPLSVSAERVFQAIAIAQYAKETGADYIAHGSTGAGNDQVRFDTIFRVLCPDKQILTPVRDLKITREDEIEYLKSKGVQDDWEKSIYSINKGIWGISVGGKETLTSDQYLPEQAFQNQLQDEEPKEIELEFQNGEPVALDGHTFSNPVHCITTLEKVASQYAIGRDMHVGDTIIGIKGRVAFEAAAPMILIKAHHAIEKHVLTKHQLLIKDQLAIFYGTCVHEGQFLEPVMRNIEAFFEQTQKQVNGKIKVFLAPYRFHILGVESDNDLMSNKFGSYGEMNSSWSAEDVKGFSKIFSNQISNFYEINNFDF